jgi:transcriptional regulator with XRE-family HTH domain
MSGNTFELRAETRLKNAKLVRLRESFGQTQEAFAEELGMSVSAYCGYENLRLFPSLATRLKIAMMAGCGIDEIFPPELRQFAKEARPRLLIRETTVDSSRLLGRARLAMQELHAPAEASSEEQVASAEILVQIVEFLKRAGDREATAVMMRLGLGPYTHGRTFSEIGKKFRVSSTRAQRLFDLGLAKLCRHCPAVADLAASRGLSIRRAPVSVLRP